MACIRTSACCRVAACLNFAYASSMQPMEVEEKAKACVSMAFEVGGVRDGGPCRRRCMNSKSWRPTLADKRDWLVRFLARLHPNICVLPNGP